MARRLRLQFSGAVYHVINRGNYRRDLFESTGAAEAFLRALGEVGVRYGWQIHAYVVMRNHFHLAVTTPEPNLVDGMHWLQSAYATRFNRFRSERGHLFQGRYQALLIEDASALCRVVDYIHLNPVRASLVPVEQVAAFRWSSLARFVKTERPAWLNPGQWLAQTGLADEPTGWRQYVAELIAQAGTPMSEQEEGELCRGWAIGTDGWRRTLAASHAHLAIDPGMAREEVQELKQARWAATLERLLAASGQSREQLRADPKGAKWKIDLANRLRHETGASHRWIAETLHMGSVSSVRSYVSRLRHASPSNQQLSA